MSDVIPYLILILIFLFFVIKQKVLKRISKNEIIIIILTVFITLIVLMLGTDIFSFLKVMNIDKYNNEMKKVISFSSKLETLIIVGFLSPILEEMTFRFVLIKILRKVFKKLRYEEAFLIINSSILFGLIHNVTEQKIQGLIAGIILGILYLYKIEIKNHKISFIKDTNLTRPILFHILFNLLNIINYIINYYKEEV